VTAQAEPVVRRDKRGRRIGHNWWREYIVDAWRSADHAWWLHREAVAMGYATEMREYAAEHPRPQLKLFMIQLRVHTQNELEAVR
jgi:RimJ/RimL family protein N-acetyltransferase